jgi:Bax protein
MVRKNINRIMVLSTIIAFVLMLMAGLAIYLTPPPQRAITTPLEDPISSVNPPIFAQLNYTYHDPTTGKSIIPRIYIKEIPEDIIGLTTAQRKNFFIKALLPLILRTNELIKEDRNRASDLALILIQNQTLKNADKNWLLNLAKRYKLPARNGVGSINFDQLLRRVGIIPPSLALAQAAIESGCGTSRFAQERNALYGQWTWGRDEAEGMVPSGREEGETHSIRSFKTPIESVLGYVKNLNTHPAYEEFRDLREYARNNDYKPTGIDLAETLISYSSRREEYIADLKNIIYTNRFLDLDEAHLFQ